MDAIASLTASLVLAKDGGARVGGERIALMEAIRDLGSIALAAKAVGLSYKGAWDAVQALNNLFDQPLVTARAGGRLGGFAVVTEEGLAAIDTFRAVEAELAHVVDALERRFGDPARPPLKSLFWSLGMKTSARNALRGVIVQVTEGVVNSEVTLRIADGIEIVAIVTSQSASDLGLAPGRAAVALIQASSIILMPGADVPRTSARNHLEGRIVEVTDGAVNSEVTLEIVDGKSLTTSLTLESRRSLGLEVGQRAVALIKAFHVILALE
ncbi:MAG TPA: TOBE domain-containing protein [Caulobacteraceae bacterium]